MNSRINGDVDNLSSTQYIYVGAAGFYDWVNSLAHAYEITKLPLYSGNYYPDDPDEQIDLGLLATPFTNKKPYDTDLLSAPTNSSPGQNAFVPGKYRAWKWLCWDESELHDQLYLYENILKAGELSASGFYAHNYSYYPAPLLRGQRLWTEISAGLSDDVMASIFDAWPGKYSYDSYNQMWVNFYQNAVCGADVDWNGIEGTAVQPPLYNNELYDLEQFSTDGQQVWEFAEIKTKANLVMNALSIDLMANGVGWLGGCSLGIYNFGNKLFHYGQVGFSDSKLRAGIAYPLLKFVDFFFDPSGHQYSNKIYDIVGNVIDYAGDFTERLKCPQLLSAAMQIDLSTVYPAWAGAGTDQYGRLIFRRGEEAGYVYDYFKANPKLLYAGYVSICDLYRTFCTMPYGSARCHNRWATVENKWTIGNEMQIEREIRHVMTGNVTNFQISGDRAEVDIQYDDVSYVWKNLSTGFNPGDNSIVVARNQATWQYDEGDAMNFVRNAKLDMTSCFVTSPDLRPNPNLPQETQDWIDRLFPPDPEERRQQDLADLEAEYEADMEKLQKELEDLQEEIAEKDLEYTQDLCNGEVDLMETVFTHFGYDVPQLVPHFPPLDVYDYDYFEQWFEPGVTNAVQNDPTLPTEDEKVQRQEEMWQYLNDIEDVAWAPGGTLYEIDAYWAPILDNLWKQFHAKEKEIDERTKKFWDDYDKIESEIYHPILPSQEDLDKIADYFDTYGGITAEGQGTNSIITVGASKVIAPLSGYMTRKYLGGYGQWQLSDNSLYWPAPAIMLGPEKDGILVREWLPYKMHFYSGDLSDVNIMYDLSSSVWGSYVGKSIGIGYADMMTNTSRNQKMWSLLHNACPRYWTTAYGNIDGYQGTMPTPPDIPSRSEHQTIEFGNPTVVIGAEENLSPRTLKQVTIQFNGQTRSNLKLIVNGKTILMSDLADGAIDLGSSIVGSVSITPDRINPNLLRFWKNGANSEYYKYEQCNFYLRNAQFVLR